MPPDPAFNPRAMMEKAIAVMSQSVCEPRLDDKTCPKVGAVLVKPDGTVETACRGELRHGDHAEFTLLERKNRSHCLDGSILFTTLEPCAPGARRHPKLACAERIVLARIKEVWVGLADPDPTVDRKGITHLQEAGIKVHLFDRDLQEIIRKENRIFVAEAMERAAASRKPKPKTITLSVLENALTTVVMDDLSSVALKKYQRLAKIKEAVPTSAFLHRLVGQGLLKATGGRFRPTGFGLLLFGKEPRTVLPQAGLLATIHYPDGTEELKDFDGPMVLIPDEVARWLGDKLPNVIDRGGMRRKEVPPLPFEMVREAVVNALIHRDYDIRQGKCQLVVTADTITIKSPGGPLPPITLEQLRSFTAPMLSRNPELHYVFAKMEMAEERGLGIKSMKTGAERSGLPLPRYTWEAPYLILTLFRSSVAAQRVLAPDTLAMLNRAEREGWQWLTKQETVTAIRYAAALGIPKRTALNHLKRFTGLGLLRRIGTGPSTKYEIVGL